MPIPSLRRGPLPAALLLASLAAPLAAQAELRAAWVARDGLGSPAQIEATLDQFAAANVQCVCVNVWSRGFTIHPSEVLFAATGQRQDPSYQGRDPLQEFLVGAHRRGIEVEAWFEYGFMFGWSGWYGGANGQGPVLNANPSWVARDLNGGTQVADGNGGFFTWASHEHPAVRQFLIDLVVEVVDRYDVDGVQFDRCRYPSTSFGYDPATSAAYQAATGQPPPSNPNLAAWKRWRADRLVAFHSDLYAAVKARRATVRVTDAPTVWPGSYDNFLQDWPQWLSTGSLDLVYPQVYRTTASSYVTTLDQQLQAVRAVDRAKVAPGIRAVTGTPTSEVLLMVAANRQRALPGHVFWYAEGLYDDLPALTSNYFQAPAAVPQRPAGFRPAPVQREDADPSTTATAGFVSAPLGGSSGGTVRLAGPSATAPDRVRFTLPVPETGLWRVLVHVPAQPNFSPAAPHEIAHAGGVELVRVPQHDPQRAGFRELGTYWLQQGSTTVDVLAVPGQVVVADAALLLRSRFTSGPMQVTGPGTPGSQGGLRLSLRGRACLGGRVDLQANRAPQLAPVAFALGFQAAATPLYGGLLQVAPASTTLGLADSGGVAALALPLPFAPALHGLPLHAQALVLDAAAAGGVGLANAVATVLP